MSKRAFGVLWLVPLAILSVLTGCIGMEEGVRGIEVKKSAKPDSLDGIAERTRYRDFNGWPVAQVEARFRLYSDQASPPLYIKVILTPGRESGLLRRPTLIGQFHLSGVSTPVQ